MASKDGLSGKEVNTASGKARDVGFPCFQKLLRETLNCFSTKFKMKTRVAQTTL